jgi:tellurite resistance protein TehA-like permease
VALAEGLAVLNILSKRGEPMMNDMMPGMVWGMGIFWLLVFVVLILSAVALIKYLRS